MGHESGYQATMDAGGNLDRDEPVGHPGYGRLTQWYEDDRLGGRVLASSHTAATHYYPIQTVVLVVHPINQCQSPLKMVKPS
jgi:hypothetical protein